ncbi:hypothetical protein CG747_32640 [Streptomyces sp. CB02959]|nr:hypothetical protein CG747_32640 [Streptomyces sp. CB02959]
MDVVGILGSRGGRWRSFIRTRRFGNQFGWLCLKALRSERAFAGRGPHRGRWGAGGVGTLRRCGVSRLPTKSGGVSAAGSGWVLLNASLTRPGTVRGTRSESQARSSPRVVE